MSVASWCCKSFCVVPCASFCTGRFVMVPLNMTYLHCLQHSLFEHLFNLYCYTFVGQNDRNYLKHLKQPKKDNVTELNVSYLLSIWCLQSAFTAILLL